MTNNPLQLNKIIISILFTLIFNFSIGICSFSIAGDISDNEAIDYMNNTYNLVNFSDKTINEALQVVPYRYTVDFLEIFKAIIVTERYITHTLNGDHEAAAKEAANYLSILIITNKSPYGKVLITPMAVGAFGAEIIEIGLKIFLKAMLEVAYSNQELCYNIVRDSGNYTHEDILRLSKSGGNDELYFTNTGWLYNYAGTKCNLYGWKAKEIPNVSPIEIYELLNTKYEADKAIQSFRDFKNEIKDSFFETLNETESKNNQVINTSSKPEKPQTNPKSLDLNERLARHYSPVIYQHVDVRDDAGGRAGRADLILPFNYDGNWRGADNWENLNAGNWENHSDKNLAATVYYSVAQTTNYWFIYYAIFHPRDWTTLINVKALFEHENDMEANALMIHKGSGFPGDIIAAMSMSHNLWLEHPIAAGVEANRDELNKLKIPDKPIADSWVPIANFINSSTVFNDSEVENALRDGHHPRIYIQSRGHGIFMAPNNDSCLNAGNRLRIDRWDQRGFPHSREFGDDFEGTGIVYYLGKGAGDSIRDPQNSNKLIDSDEKRHGGPADDHQNRWAKYQLAQMRELWKRRTEADRDKTFEVDEDGLQAFHGLAPSPKEADDNLAHPPWTMPASRVCPPEPDDIVSEPGEIFLDPLSAFPKHFNFENAESAILQNDPLLTKERYDVDPPAIDPIIADQQVPVSAVSIASAFILDSSGSMAWDNKIGCARLGVEGAIRALSEGDYASVSHFSTLAQTPPGLESKPVLDLVAETNTDNQDSALSKIHPGGGTCIGKGLREGLIQLNGAPQTLHKAAVLLSDGEDTCGGNGQQQINEQVETYAKKYIPITTIKYGKDANEKNLRNIAAKTGGSYAEGNCGNIPATFFRLGSEIALKALLLAASEVMKPGGTIIYNIFVEGDSRNLGIFADWQGSKLRITLHSPTGEIYSREDFLNKGGRFTEGKRYQFAELQNPTPGNWQVELTWDEPPPTAEQVNTTVVSKTDIFSSILGFKPQYNIGDKVLINVAASEIGNGFQKHPLQGAKVTAMVQIPGPEIIRMIHAQNRNMRVYKDLVQDNTLNVQLFDDGAHGDFKAGDGVWGGFFTKTQKKGPYIVTASIEGRKRNGTGVKRQSVSAFQVGSLLDAVATPSQVLQYNQKQLAKLKSKINNPLGTMQESSMDATQANPAPKSKKKKRSRSLMDKISN